MKRKEEFTVFQVLYWLHSNCLFHIYFQGDPVEIARFMREGVKKELKKCIDEAQQYIYSISGPKLALIIDGKCLMYALDPSLRVMLLNLSLNCSSVVCCRVSPLQKAQVRSLMESPQALLIRALSRREINKELL